MVQDLTQLNAVFSSPKTMAFGRLKELKSRQGYYHPAPVTVAGQDTIAIKSARLEPEKPVAEVAQSVAKQPQKSETSRSIGGRTAKVGVIVALSLLGGIIGGGPLGAILAGAGATGLVLGQKLAKADAPNRIMDSLMSLRIPTMSLPRMGKAASLENETDQVVESAVVPAADKSDNLAAGAVKSEPVLAPAFGSSDNTQAAREMAKERLKNAILAASLQAERPAVNAFAAAFGNNQATRAKGFDAASSRYRIMHPETAKFAPRLRRLPSGNHRILESIPIYNLVEPLGFITLHRNQAKLLVISPDSAQPIEILRGVRLGKALRDKRQSVTDAALRDTETVLDDLKEVMADHDIRPENIRVVLGEDLQGVRDSEGRLLPERLGRSMGLPVEVLDATDKADMLYAGTIRNQSRHVAQQRNMVMDIQPGVVTFALSRG